MSTSYPPDPGLRVDFLVLQFPLVLLKTRSSHDSSPTQRVPRSHTGYPLFRSTPYRIPVVPVDPPVSLELESVFFSPILT